MQDYILISLSMNHRLLNPKVKELLTSVHICQSYRKNKSGPFLWHALEIVGVIIIITVYNSV